MKAGVEKLLSYFKQKNRREKKTMLQFFFFPIYWWIEWNLYVKLFCVCTFLCSTFGWWNPVLCSKSNRDFISMESSGKSGSGFQVILDSQGTSFGILLLPEVGSNIIQQLDNLSFIFWHFILIDIAAVTQIG